MPIRFRCPHCSKLLGIATRKAGTAVACPKCEQSVTVPQPADATLGGELDEIDQLLGKAATAPEPATPVAAPAASRRKSGDSLFETGDVDDLLGFTPALPSPAEQTPRPVPRPTAGVDALSLDDPNGPWVLSPQKAALLVVAVVALLGVAFAAGFVIANLL